MLIPDFQATWPMVMSTLRLEQLCCHRTITWAGHLVLVGFVLFDISPAFFLPLTGSVRLILFCLYIQLGWQEQRFTIHLLLCLRCFILPIQVWTKTQTRRNRHSAVWKTWVPSPSPEKLGRIEEKCSKYFRDPSSTAKNFLILALQGLQSLSELQTWFAYVYDFDAVFPSSESCVQSLTCQMKGQLTCYNRLKAKRSRNNEIIDEVQRPMGPAHLVVRALRPRETSIVIIQVLRYGSVRNWQFDYMRLDIFCAIILL